MGINYKTIYQTLSSKVLDYFLGFFLIFILFCGYISDETIFYYFPEQTFILLHVPCIGMDDEDSDTSPLHEMLDDKLRVAYFKGYLASVAQAIK